MRKFIIHCEDKITGEKIKLIVLGENVDSATRSLSSLLFGMDGQYIWKGSEPYREGGFYEKRESL